MQQLTVAILVDDPAHLEICQRMAAERILDDSRLQFAGFCAAPEAAADVSASRIFSWWSRLEKRLVSLRAAHRTSGQKKVIFPVIEAFDLLNADLIVNFSLFSLPEDRLPRFRYGEWRFNFSDERSRDADWFGYGPVLNEARYTQLVLSARTVCGQHGVISTARFNIKPSGAMNNGFAKERAVSLLLRELRRLALTGGHNSELKPTPRPAPAPTPMETISYVTSLAYRTARRAVRNTRERLGWEAVEWTLYTGKGTLDSFDLKGANEIAFDPLDIRADPFLFCHGDKLYLFYEAYAVGGRVAHIAVGMLENGQLKPLGSVLRRPYHLSYPYIFRDGADIFMIPETHSARRIEVWRCTDFPHQWELHATALEGVSAADSVLFKRHDGWWLFTNISEFQDYEDHCSELHVFKVDGPALRQLFPHKLNPVVLGSDTARNAGRITENCGRLYRPSQCNSGGIYGYGLNIMEINELDLNSYRETPIRVIEPDFKPGLFGCHHFDSAGGAFVVDARVSC